MSEQETRDKIAQLTAGKRARHMLWGWSDMMKRRYIDSGDMVPSKQEYLDEMRSYVESQSQKIGDENPLDEFFG